MGVIERLLQLIDVLLLGITFLLLYAGHWTTWIIIPGATDKEGQLKRVLAYVYGVGCILAILYIWYIARQVAGIVQVSTWEPVRFALAVSIVAGLGTITPRLFRMFKEYDARGKDLDRGQADD